MPVYIGTTVGAIGMSGLRFGKLKSIVARVVGGQDRPDEVGAGDAVNMALDRLNEFNWDYLTVRGTDIAVVDGTATYALPTPFKSPLSLRLTTNERPLRYLRRQDYDYAVLAQTVKSTPVAYSLFNSALSGNVELLPTPSAADTMQIRYYRPIAKPGDENALLDVMDWMERAVILDAQVSVGQWNDLESSRLQMLELRARDALIAILSADRNVAGEDVGFKSRTQTGLWLGDNYVQDYIEG